MKAGLIIFLVGLVLVAYTYINYLWASNKLSQLKKEDLDRYYLDLAQFLYPVPFWSGVIGMVAIVIALIVVLINIPAVF